MNSLVPTAPPTRGKKLPVTSAVSESQWDYNAYEALRARCIAPVLRISISRF